jgi:hypothetical protein
MPGVVRIYTYRISPPSDPLTLAVGMQQAGELIHKHNKHVEAVTIQHDGGDIILKLTMKGHDQWWIKKKVIYPLAALLTKTGIQLKDARLESVDRPPDPRSTRPRASDGRSAPLPPDAMIDHSDVLGKPAG